MSGYPSYQFKNLTIFTGKDGLRGLRGTAVIAATYGPSSSGTILIHFCDDDRLTSFSDYVSPIAGGQCEFYLPIGLMTSAVSIMERDVNWFVSYTFAQGTTKPVGKIGYLSQPKAHNAVKSRKGPKAAIRRSVWNRQAWGFVDGNLQLVIDFSYYETRPFSEGRAVVAPFGGGIVYINTLGEVISPNYWVGGNFVDSRAFVASWSDRRIDCHVVDSDFRIIASAGDEARHGEERKYCNGLLRIGVSGRWMYLDHSGSPAFEGGYIDAKDFGDDLAPVKAKNGRWHYINRLGVPAFNNRQFDLANEFGEGLAYTQTRGRGEVMNTRGEVQFRVNGDEETVFRNGWAMIPGGYVDSSGEVIRGRWAFKHPFTEGFACVGEEWVEHGTAWGMVGANGEYHPKLAPKLHQVFTPFEHGYAAVDDTLVNHKGDVVWPVGGRNE